MPMLPWPVWPLAAQATLGQNVVAGSIRLSSESRWGTYPEEVCLDPHFHGKHTIPRLSVELPSGKNIYFNGFFLTGRLKMSSTSPRLHKGTCATPLCRPHTW